MAGFQAAAPVPGNPPGVRAHGVDQHDDRQLPGIAQLHVPGDLLRGVLVDGAALHGRVAGDDADAAAAEPTDLANIVW